MVKTTPQTYHLHRQDRDEQLLYLFFACDVNPLGEAPGFGGEAPPGAAPRPLLTAASKHTPEFARSPLTPQLHGPNAGTAQGRAVPAGSVPGRVGRGGRSPAPAAGCRSAACPGRPSGQRGGRGAAPRGLPTWERAAGSGRFC